MVRAAPFAILFAPIVKEHLKAIDRKHHGLIRETIELQLTHEPLVETRNRKPLIREVEFEATWELRFGPDNRFRVFYSVDVEQRVVNVVAVGVKRGNRLMIGGEEIEL
jgi:mRNA-degrading endonuclease RelE of RelBE toxin-antitoxin system